ncbi:hypothetical protein I4U23_003801 [Adineta vaga]|nr:hypothetical protein I4U23_003801 [Adineta vaga]
MSSKKSPSHSASKTHRHSRPNSRSESRSRSATKSRRGSHPDSRSTSKSRSHSRTSKSASRNQHQKQKKHHYRNQYRHLKYHAAVEYRCLNQKNDFVKNQSELIRKILDHANKENWSKSHSIPHDFISYIRHLQPVHQCAPEIFESICILGHVLSKEYRDDLINPSKAVEIAIQHNGVRRLIPDLLVDDADIYITNVIEREYDKHNNLQLRENEHRSIIKEKGTLLKVNLGEKTVRKIKDYAIRVAKAALTLLENKPGVNHDKDKDFGTDRHIFAILGPHPGNYGDVFIVFKREIMLHPDSNFSSSAATTYGQSSNAYKHQPWLTDPKAEKERILCFHSNKMHCSINGYENVAAHSLMALCGKDTNTLKVSLKKAQEWWCDQDPHFVFEAHLPSRVPLDYIDSIYMPKNVFKSYSPQLQKSLRQFFGHSLHVTQHDVDQNDKKNRGELTDKNSRSAYQKYVNDNLIKKFSRSKQNLSHRMRGTALTVAQSEFVEHIRLPMTISQQCTLQMQLSKNKMNLSSKSPTYIYWQAMWGDMMLTVSNEPLNIRSLSDKNLQCLVCYIARVPSPLDKDYQESYSYITNGTPLQHKFNISRRNYHVGSHTFHRHCKFDDYVTYRLKIERDNGQVTLSHAGRDSYHNKEKLIYRFKKSELDLSKLIYVHISANEHPVAIRNLTIRFERAHHSHTSVKHTTGHRRSSKQGNSQTRRSQSRKGSLSSSRGRNRSRSSGTSHRSRSTSKNRKPRRTSVASSKRSTSRHRSKSSDPHSH